MELLKALAKFILILFVALTVLSSDIDDLLRIAHEPLESAIIHSVQVVGWSALWMACGLIIIAAVDVPIQLWESHKKLLMTKQEVRDEHKDQEGRPEVKQRIRQLQREMSQRKMMAAIPDADVVITNPTHYAVALKYDPEKGGAPMLLAKGSDFLALKIREIAVANDILLLESPALARSIFYSTDLDQEIPGGLVPGRCTGTGLRLPDPPVPRGQGQAAGAAQGRSADPAGPASRLLKIALTRSAHLRELAPTEVCGLPVNFDSSHYAAFTV